MRGDNQNSSAGGTYPSVCVVTHPLGSAGENATRTLLNILAEVTTVSLVTANLPTESEIWDEYEVVELTQEGAGTENVLLAAIRFMLNQFKMCIAIAKRPEPVILFFGATTYLFPIMFAKLLGRTVILEPRGDVPLTLHLYWDTKIHSSVSRALAKTLRVLEKIGYLVSDLVVTYTPGMAEQLDLDPDDETVYADGARYVDTTGFSPTVPFEQRDRIAGLVGRLDEEKGIRTLAEAVELLPSNIGFRFIGDGDLLPWLRERLADQVEVGQVEIVGWVDHDEIPSEMNELRLLVLPSQPTEGLPTTILESLACGTPVYATPVSGVPDVVIEGQTGFLMAETTPDSIANGIEAALDDPDINNLSSQGRDLIESRFNFESAVERYRTLFHKLDYDQDIAPPK